MSDNNLIYMISGRPATGKTSCLRNVEADKTGYLNCDNKPIPLRNSKDFKSVQVKNPGKILKYLKAIESSKEIERGVLDTINHLMNMYESQYVLTSDNTQQAWGEYAQFYQNFIHTIKTGSKPFVVFSHQAEVMDKRSKITEIRSPVKGSVGRIGIEADFTTILGAKRLEIDVIDSFIEEYGKSDLLTISDRERRSGYKVVLQTEIDEDTVEEKIRSPWGMWEENERFIDNDCKLVEARLREFYGM